MDQPYLLDKIQSIPKLSLTTSISEYFDWQDGMEEFFKGHGFTSVIKMYYAEETFDNDVLQWWLNVDDHIRTWGDMTCVLRRRFVYDAMNKAIAHPLEPKKNILSSSGSSYMVVSEFSCTTQFEKNASTNHAAIMGLPSDLSAATSIVGADVKVKAGGSDFSLTPGQKVCESSYDDPVEPLIRIPAAVVDSFNVSSIEPSLAIDMTSALSLMSHEVQRDGTIANVMGQRSNIFQSECKIQDKVCKLIIDGGSFTNAISSDLVNALSLPTRRLPKPHYMRWMNESGTLKITHKTRVKFSIGNYMDTVDCDVVPMSACHLLLGRPWQFDLDATHGGRSNNYSFVHKGVHHVLKPMPVSAIKAEVFATSKVKKKVAAITPKPRTALFLEGENDMAIPVSIHCAANSEISTNARKKDAITISPIVDLENICKDSKAIAGKLLKPSTIHFGSLADEEKQKDKKNIAAIMSCNNRVRKVDPIKHANAENIPKSRTTLIQGGENDESMADQNIHHRVVQNTYKLQFGSFGEWQSDMNDGVIYDITNNSTKTIVFGANLSKNIVEKNLFFKYGKTLVRI